MARFKNVLLPYLALVALNLLRIGVAAAQFDTLSDRDSNVFIVEFEGNALASADFKDRTALVHDAPHIAFEQFLTQKIGNDHFVRFRFTDPRFLLASSVQLSNAADEEKLRAFPGVKRVYRARQYALTATVRRMAQTSDTVDSFKISERAALPSVDTFEAHRMTGFDKVYAQGFRGQGQTVAVIDTGVEYKHHALNGGKADGVACFGKGCPIKGGFGIFPTYPGDTNVTFSPDVYDTCSGHGTTTAGTIIANAPDRNFAGSAPEATMLVYKVFSCNAGPYDDHIVAAMLRAFQDGADIISLSIARPGGWPKDGPPSLLVPKLARAGVITVAGPANVGLTGFFYGAAPGSAQDITSVGSVQNNVLSGFTAQVISSDGEHEFSYMSFTQFKFNQTSKLPVFAISKTPNQPRDACEPLSDSTPDLSGFVVLIAGSSNIEEDCSAYIKIDNAAAKGARTILIYNSAPASLEVDISQVANGVQTSVIFGSDGLSILDLVKKGDNVMLDFSDSVAVNIIDEEFGGQINEWSGKGPTWELQGSVSFLAVGGGLLCTTLLSQGGYEVEDGVSQSIPMVAGLYASYRSAKGTGDTSEELRSIFASTASPVTVSKSSPVLASVAEQGGGLVNIHNAINSITRVSPHALHLNDTVHFNGQQTLTITNVGTTSQHFSLVHRPAGTVHTCSDSSKGQYLDGLIRPVQGEQASAAISPATFDLEPGHTRTVTVTFTPPPTNQPKLPIYTGFIEARSDQEFGTVRASYLGVSGSMNALPILNRTGLPAIVDSVTLQPTFEDNKVYTLFPNGTGGPILGYRFLSGTARMAIDLVPANFTLDMLATSKTVPPSDQSRNDPPAYVPGHIARVDTRNYWPRDDPSNGILTSATSLKWTDYQNVTRTIDGGSYRFLLRALKIFGDPEAEDSYEAYVSPIFVVKQGGTA
ncbi:hypothetical protein CF326_g3943 [Tilletia indica]|nr:hypothetical protein CF326_g3943 [Tilletia indica]